MDIWGDRRWVGDGFNILYYKHYFRNKPAKVREEERDVGML